MPPPPNGISSYVHRHEQECASDHKYMSDMADHFQSHNPSTNRDTLTVKELLAWLKKEGGVKD